MDTTLFSSLFGICLSLTIIDSSIWFVDVEVVVTDSTNPEDAHENEKCKPTDKIEKKKTKIAKKGKSKKDEKAGKTKSKKFHQRLLSLFCCCFKVRKKTRANNQQLR